jgi:hypothetical protein
MYKNNPTSEATIKETATSIVEVFEKYLLSIDIHSTKILSNTLKWTRWNRVL